jgi:purine-nucleoside phosphorylase
MKKKSDPVTTAKFLRQRSGLRPSLAIVLGSGFKHALDRFKIETEIPYRELPSLSPTGIPGHANKLLLGHFGNLPVLILNGRVHFYEGHDMEQVTFPVRMLGAFGIKDLVLTNAAGGINPRFQPGDFMLLNDHINLMGVNPLRGPAAAGCERFIDLSDVYDRRLNRLLHQAAHVIKLRLHRGVYLAISGPSYETPAEIRAFKRLGADAVGMSTVPEAIVARQCRMNVAALSCITNQAAGCSPKRLDHADVLDVGAKNKDRIAGLFDSFSKLYARD